MARASFYESALTRHDEAEEASKNLLASLDELRRRADNFLAVAGSTAAIFGALARASSTGPTVADSDVGPSAGNGTLTGPEQRAPSRPELDPTAPDSARNGATASPDAAPRDVVVSRGASGTDADERVTPRAITSAHTAVGRARTPLSFTVTTSGTSVPCITARGDLPKHLSLIDNGDGTASIFGTPMRAGVYRVTIRAKFGRSTSKYVVAQAFTLAVMDQG